VSDELLEEVEHHVKVAAAQVSRRYRGYVEYADLIQEGNLWVIRHPATVRNRMDDGRRGEARLVGQLAKAMERSARRDRAASMGFKVEDEAFYQRTLVEAALPGIWDDEYLIKAPQDEYTTEGSRHRTDQSETSNWLVTVLDVRSAWERAELNESVRIALTLRYRDGLRLSQVAAELRVSDTTASNYIDRGIRALINELGGRPPAQCGPDCECGQGVGRRKVISNAEANARTEENY
jgi:DNA-directed RNA polymerase specialized sigma24 family protein